MYLDTRELSYLTICLFYTIKKCIKRSFIAWQIIDQLRHKKLGMNLNEDWSYISGLRRRDSKTYEVVFKKYYLSLVVFVVRHVGDEDVAKDIVQDIFFKLFESSRSLPDNFQLKSWFYKVARNAAVDYLRHLQVEDKYKFLMAEAMINVPDMDEEIDEQVYTKVNLAIESLPEQCRLIIKLNVLEGKKYHEIAEELGITINTIRTQVSRGYKKLREILAEEVNTSILVYMFLKN